jgi:hypothetical protein
MHGLILRDQSTCGHAWIGGDYGPTYHASSPSPCGDTCKLSHALRGYLCALHSPVWGMQDTGPTPASHPLCGPVGPSSSCPVRPPFSLFSSAPSLPSGPSLYPYLGVEGHGLASLLSAPARPPASLSSLSLGPPGIPSFASFGLLGPL